MLNGPHHGRILPWPSSSRLNEHLLQLRSRCILHWLHRSRPLQYAPPPLVIKGWHDNNVSHTIQQPESKYQTVQVDIASVSDFTAEIYGTMSGNEYRYGRQIDRQHSPTVSHARLRLVWGSLMLTLAQLAYVSHLGRGSKKLAVCEWQVYMYVLKVTCFLKFAHTSSLQPSRLPLDPLTPSPLNYTHLSLHPLHHPFSPLAPPPGSPYTPHM